MKRTFIDPTGYVGPLRFLEVMLGSKNRPGSGTWADMSELITIVWDSAFVTQTPLKDSHGQIAHYARSFDLFDKKDDQRNAELFERLDTIPHLADFHVDIDHDDPELSRQEAVRLVDHYLSLGVPEQAIGVRFSGSKGFHVTLPWQVLGVREHGVIGLNYITYRILGGYIIDAAKLEGADRALWRRNGTIRLENTVHPSSGLLKVRVSLDELRSGMETCREVAKAPRKPLYTPEEEEAARQMCLGIHRLYLVAQAEADAEVLRVSEHAHRELPPEILAQVQGKLTPCLRHILDGSPNKGTRNETLFHAAMMMKYTGIAQDEALAKGREWLGASYRNVGGEGTIRSAYRGPFAGGCRWMREQGYATQGDCRACPVGQRRYEQPARIDKSVVPEQTKVELPTLAEQRERLRKDIDNLNPDRVTVVSTPAGLGKTHEVLKRAGEIVANGGRVLLFVKDTLKVDGLAADMVNELRFTHDYNGKIQILYGRNEDNCDNWTEAEKVLKKGYSVGKQVCKGCYAREFCEYYQQYNEAFEAGIYIAPHAMLPIIFADNRRGFSREFIQHTDEDGRTYDIGGPLKMIVIDEDALHVLIDRYFIGQFHLLNELKQKTRWVTDRLTGTKSQRVVLDSNYLRVVSWARLAIKVVGPFMPALDSIARADGQNLAATLHAIDPTRIIDPDFQSNKGHKPFTTRFYLALQRELPRLRDGNFTIWANGAGLEIMETKPVSFPPSIPVVVLDAYANEGVYRRYFRATGINRIPEFHTYPVREQANTTYVLGANLLQTDLDKAAKGARYAIDKIEKLMRALRVITSDGIETYIIAKRAFFESEAWVAWKDRLPYCVEDGDAGRLYFWRGRGINAAAGKRVAVLQVPNFHPSSVLAEASVLFANEPRLDDQRMPVETELVWASNAKDRAEVKVDRTVYADERLNLINERYRLDELVQMALRSRSLTTGAEIIIFADLPDPRLPAQRVLTIDELVAQDDTYADDARKVLYDALRDAEALTIDSLIELGVIGGKPKNSRLRSAIKDRYPNEYKIAVQNPVDEDKARAEVGVP